MEPTEAELRRLYYIYPNGSFLDEDDVIGENSYE